MTAIATIEEQPQQLAPRASAGSITDLLYMAVEKGTPVAELKELVALHEQMENRQAQRDFSLAMVAFQAECPSIKKSSSAKVATKVGSGYSYKYAELDEIASVINPLLAKHGLSYGWDSSVGSNAITVVCTVRHANGFSIKSTMTVPVENPSAMNPQQKVGAAMTYAQRRSLSSALGLTTTDEDTDGRGKGDDGSTITDEQALALVALATEAGVDIPKFLEYMKVASMDKILQSDHAKAERVLNARKASK